MPLLRYATPLLLCCAGLIPLSSDTPPARIAAPLIRPQAQEGADATLSPYFFVKSGDASVDQLPLKSTSAKVAISGVIADVRVTQVYANTGHTPLEAIYVFPGSTRSAVYGMKMSIGKRVLVAKIQERGQARATYEQARAEGRSASLLEQQRPNVFQMNVANIMPGDEIRVELSYTELLVPTEGTYAFVYPTVVGPRYAGTPGTPSHTGERWVANPYTHAGEAPLNSFDLELRLDAGMPIQRMACDTHKTSITYDGSADALLKLDPSEAQGGNQDFILKYQLAGGQVQSGLLLQRGEKENYFLLMAQPPKRVAPQDMPAREYVFIMDVSGSQMGFPLEISKTLMKEMIQGLRPQDYFNVMVFEGSSALWSPSSQHATPENLQQAIDFVHTQNGGGGTELGSAMLRALTLPRVPGLSRSFVVSTDGYISADAHLFDIIRQHVGDANLFAFGIGSSVNRHLIEGMAHVGMGEAFVVTRPDQAAAEAERFRTYISSPVLTNVKLATNGFQIYDVEPLQLPDVLADRPVICFGKWKGEQSGTISLSGVGGRGAWHQDFEVAQVKSSGNPALRQLWARERIKLLSDYNQFGADQARTDEITQLGLAYNLLTAYTSFVAVDTQVRNTGGHASQITQPLPLPEGVSDSAVGAAQQRTRSGALNAPAAKMTAHEDLGSIRSFRVTRGDAMGAAGATAKISPPPSSPSSEPKSEDQAHRVRFQALSCDRPELKLDALRAELEAKLKAPALHALLAGLPKDTVLEVVVDGAGHVVHAAFNKPFSDAVKALAAIQAWRFSVRPAQGKATIRLTLRSEA